MELSLSWEAASRSPTQVFPNNMEPKESLPGSEKPAACPCPEPDESILYHTPPIFSKILF
jgi:hypothetical protein